MAIWWAFVAVALIPFPIILFFYTRFTHVNPVFYFEVTWRLLCLIALVYFTRNAVLRARELYADVRASVYDQQLGALRRMFASKTHPQKGFWQHLRTRLLSLVLVHPSAEERCRAI